VVAGAESSSAAVCVPPVLCTSPVLGSGVDDAAEEVPSVSVDDVDDDGVFNSDEEADAAGFFSAVDEESAGLVEADDVALESVGSASATPGMVAAAHPTPSTTANAPTRPTYLT
jgi:hypothetical protein